MLVQVQDRVAHGFGPQAESALHGRTCQSSGPLTLEPGSREAETESPVLFEGMTP
jgi:hypothetical protein